MRLFDLYPRDPELDEPRADGSSSTYGKPFPVAQGVEFDDGSCAIRWLDDKTTMVASIADVRAIRPSDFFILRSPHNTYDRARLDAHQDRVENSPFASVGGPTGRGDMTVPDYIKAEDRQEYLRGYVQGAKEMYGEDCLTCDFQWKLAMTIP